MPGDIGPQKQCVPNCAKPMCNSFKYIEFRCTRTDNCGKQPFVYRVVWQQLRPTIQIATSLKRDRERGISSQYGFNGSFVGRCRQSGIGASLVLSGRSFIRNVNGSYAPNVSHSRLCQNLLKADIINSLPVVRIVGQSGQPSKDAQLRREDGSHRVLR